MQQAGECFDVLGRNQTTKERHLAGSRPVWWNHIILEMVDDPYADAMHGWSFQEKGSGMESNDMVWYGSEWGDMTTMTRVTDGEWPCNEMYV
jgi:hypothetical protein